MTLSITRTLSYGQSSIRYELLQTKRKTLEIAVHPDKRVVVRAPASYSIKTIEDSVQKRARWIDKQISWFSQFDPRTPPRQFVGGESHLYLGRKYRLKIQPSSRDLVLLKHGFIHIETRNPSPAHVEKLMNAWYQSRAEQCLAEIFEQCWERFSKGSETGKGGGSNGTNAAKHGSPGKNDKSSKLGTGMDFGKGGTSSDRQSPVKGKPFLTLRKMKTRWGSLSTIGRLTLNTELIQAPRECIEYVVYHELCHLYHQNHGPEYYQLLDRTLPDWKQRKQKLEKALI